MKKICVAEPSVRSLFIQMCFNGQPLATGTGFVVQGKKGPILITNRHNVTGRHQETDEPISGTGGIPNELVVLHHKFGRLGEWVPKTEPIKIDDRPRWVEHPKLGRAADFVALPLSEDKNLQYFYYDLHNDEPYIHISPTEIVSVVGFPFGISGGGALAVWATGFIASEPDIDWRDKPVFLIDCRTRQGQSGSPVIAYRPAGAAFNSGSGATISNVSVVKLLGIYSGRINRDSDLGIVWKAQAIAELISSLDSSAA